MKKLLTLAIISMLAISCTNTETPQSVKQEVNSSSKTNLQARGEGQEIKDPANLTEAETKEMITEAIEAVKFFEQKPTAIEYSAQSGRKAVILCTTGINSAFGHACVYNSSGYLVYVGWSDPDSFLRKKVYYGIVTNQCNC